MSSHAVYAPSSAHRWTRCTASAEAIACLPEQEEGEEAREGTEAHEEIERILGPYSGDGLGFWMERPEYPAIDPKHPAAYGVALVLDFVRQLPPGSMWIEQRVMLTPEIWGRCDVAHWDEAARILTIVDYKNGYVGVDAEENEQLMIYAAASIYTHNLRADWIRLVVVQPNDFRPVPRVKQWICSAADLYAFASRVAAIPAGPKSFQAGEHCRYCPLFGRCDATRDLLAHLAKLLQHPPADVPSPIRKTVFTLRKPIEDWFKGADKAWTKDALAGNPPPGMQLVQTMKHRAWKDEAVVRPIIIEKCGVESLELPSPSQAEKLGLDKEWIAEQSTRPEGGPALALASDKRPEWKQKSAAEMFAAAVKELAG